MAPSSHPGPAKQPEDITVPLPCLALMNNVVFPKCSVSFTPNVMGRKPSKKFHFCLLRPQNIIPKVFCTSLCVFCQLWFWVETVSWMLVMSLLFLLAES